MTEEAIEKNHETERRGEIRAVMSFVSVLAILAAAIGVAVMFKLNSVKVNPAEINKSLPSVLTMPLVVSTHEPKITSEGVIRSRREVRLSAEVSGGVTAVSDELIEGGTVKEGEVLAEIDGTNYVAALARARSSEADARLNLEIEEAKTKQAEKDWGKLGGGRELPRLVGRLPQRDSAMARVESAVAETAKAEKDLEDTKIKAPFSGRIREASVEVGAVLIPGSMVAELYSDTDLEVRLPFSLRDFGLVHRGESKQEIVVEAQVGPKLERWPARVVRREGEVERSTLSGYAIAKILPSESGSYPPVGLFVRTAVLGTTLEDVVEIPRQALRGSSEVWVVIGEDSEEVELRRRTVDVVRTSRESVVVRGDFEPGDRLVVTRLSAPVDGMKVKELEESPSN